MARPEPAWEEWVAGKKLGSGGGRSMADVRVGNSE